MRSPTQRRATLTPVARIAIQVMLPSPTPARSTATPAPSAAPAAPAAVKIAAHEAIVSGFDAVAPSAVANALRGELTSSSTSPPSRTRKALTSVRIPR